jgi:hypothetical protein
LPTADTPKGTFASVAAAARTGTACMAIIAMAFGAALLVHAIPIPKEVTIKKIKKKLDLE